MTVKATRLGADPQPATATPTYSFLKALAPSRAALPAPCPDGWTRGPEGRCHYTAAGAAGQAGANPLDLATIAFPAKYTFTFSDRDHRFDAARQAIEKKWKEKRLIVGTHGMGNTVAYGMSQGQVAFATFKNTHPDVQLPIDPRIAKMTGTSPRWGRFYDGKTYTVKYYPKTGILDPVTDAMGWAAEAAAKGLSWLCDKVSSPEGEMAVNGIGATQGDPRAGSQAKAVCGMLPGGGTAAPPAPGAPPPPAYPPGSVAYIHVEHKMYRIYVPMGAGVSGLAGPSGMMLRAEVPTLPPGVLLVGEEHSWYATTAGKVGIALGALALVGGGVLIWRRRKRRHK
jgi:hypothetical protein